MKDKVSKGIIDSILIVIGTFIMGISIDFFLLPNKITTGGASGIATILYYKFNLNMGTMILLINVPLFAIAIKKFGIKFSLKSIAGTFLFTFFIDLISLNTYIGKSKTDMIISAIYGGLLLGIGLSLVFKAGGSTGGSDLLAQILRKKGGTLNLGKIMLTIDSVIIASLIIAFNDINLGLYSIISIFISSKMIEIIFEGVNYTKVINIVTKNDDAITNQIIEGLKRGATVTKCIGAYTREEYINITCVVTLREIAKVKRIAHEIDPHAFIYISNAVEVWGEGFRRF